MEIPEQQRSDDASIRRIVLETKPDGSVERREVEWRPLRKVVSKN